MDPERPERPERLRLDELSRSTGVPTSTIRLYRQRGLLHPPQLQGRTGWYDSSHVARLQVIGRLQKQGFSLVSIGELIERWDAGQPLDELVLGDAPLALLVGGHREIVVTVAELADRYPTHAVTPEAIHNAVSAGLLELTEDGRIRVPDRRFLEVGAALAHLGIPLDAVVAEWERLRAATDEIAERFAALFEEHLMPPGWMTLVERGEAKALAEPLPQLAHLANQVIAASFDASIAMAAAERFGVIVDALSNDES